MTELKPCPFCGGEAEDVLEWFDECGECRIECTQCGASVDTVDAWNTRHVETCRYVGDDVSGGCSECRGWLDPACAYCPSCGRKVEG